MLYKDDFETFKKAEKKLVRQVHKFGATLPNLKATHSFLTPPSPHISNYLPRRIRSNLCNRAASPLNM